MEGLLELYLDFYATGGDFSTHTFYLPFARICIPALTDFCMIKFRSLFSTTVHILCYNSPVAGSNGHPRSEDVQGGGGPQTMAR